MTALAPTNSSIQELLEIQVPLPSVISEARANCFNAVQLFWADEIKPTFTAPSDFVAYLEAHFRQLSNHEKQLDLDVAVVWSRSADILPLGLIRTDTLNRRDAGYPFGLVIEHAFVIQDENMVFQKRDPSANGAYEIVGYGDALQPYLKRAGFEVTHHRRR